jgi:5-methylcytosine-specific restriction endonuclease McrA
MPLSALLVIGRRTNRRHLRLRLVAAGIKEDQCERCRRDEWCGEPLGMQLHHVNGDGLDNRLDNLMLLCPNCHSLTETWGGRNRGRTAHAA